MKAALNRWAGLALAALLGLPACQRPEQYPRPADLLPREKIVAVLVDVQTLESQVEQSHLPPDSAQALFLAQQKELLWRHAVTDSSFRQSYRYYGGHGRDLDEIYGAVIDTLDHRAFRLSH